MGDDLPFWIAFSVFPGIGPVRFRLLLSYFQTAQRAYEASEQELKSVGLSDRILSAFLDFRRSFNSAAYQNLLRKMSVRVITLNNPDYPPLLAGISDSPFLLYCFGEGSLSLLSYERLIAIVGTRKMTQYGELVTSELTRELVNAGCGIVSGMALGVDGMAHKIAVENDGITIAVLGCGVDLIAPASHRDLYFKIAKKGLIVSEMPLGLRPDKGTFPARNRIISGLVKGVLVTEGAKDSGSLITARYAAEQGRDVFAVPGPINNPMSEGPSVLIKNGAKVVTSANDILEEYGWDNKPRNKHADHHALTPDERRILAVLGSHPSSFDELVVETKIAAPMLSSILSTLEIIEVISLYDDHTYHLAILPR